MCVMEMFRKIGVIPVIVLEDPDDAIPVAKALSDGGILCAEITFRTDAAEESIHRIASAFPDMLVGAGTVLSIDQAKKAAAAGAKFIVSPGTNPDIVKYCQSIGMSICPGVQTPTEIEAALSMGLKVVKFFPAEAAGGLKTIKALAAPYNMMEFVPTGGINLSNIREYLSYEKVIACGGSWIASKNMIKAKDYEHIRETAASSSEIVKEVRG